MQLRPVLFNLAVRSLAAAVTGNRPKISVEQIALVLGEEALRQYFAEHPELQQPQ
jgi:hypothetical protein